MDYVILGGDERFAALAALLEREGNEVVRLRAWPSEDRVLREALASAGHVVLNWPMKLRGEAPDLGELLASTAPESTLCLCGPGVPEGLPAGRRAVDLWRDEALVCENAALTAEGALNAAMNAARRSIRALPAMVIGWGRIGRALTELLVALGVPVVVASRREDHRCQAAVRGAEAVDTACIARALPGRRLVFNTAPNPVLTEAELEGVDDGAMLIDLASAPFGIDLNAAWRRGLRAWREPGLPGRYCPESAALALRRAMDRAGRDAR